MACWGSLLSCHQLDNIEFHCKVHLDNAVLDEQMSNVDVLSSLSRTFIAMIFQQHNTTLVLSSVDKLLFCFCGHPCSVFQKNPCPNFQQHGTCVKCCLLSHHLTQTLHPYLILCHQHLPMEFLLFCLWCTKWQWDKHFWIELTEKWCHQCAECQQTRQHPCGCQWSLLESQCTVTFTKTLGFLLVFFLLKHSHFPHVAFLGVVVVAWQFLKWLDRTKCLQSLMKGHAMPSCKFTAFSKHANHLLFAMSFSFSLVMCLQNMDRWMFQTSVQHAVHFIIVEKGDFSRFLLLFETKPSMFGLVLHDFSTENVGNCCCITPELQQPHPSSNSLLLHLSTPLLVGHLTLMSHAN